MEFLLTAMRWGYVILLFVIMYWFARNAWRFKPTLAVLMSFMLWFIPVMGPIIVSLLLWKKHNR